MEFQDVCTVNTCPPFFGFTPVIPDFYWNVADSEERIKKICKLYDALMRYCEQLGDATNENADAIKQLQDLFEQFMASGFDDYYAAQIQQWIEDNLEWLWKTFAQMVFFGITDDGYFCAYVPESWSDIVFDTGAVYGSEYYGRLILRYLVSGEGVIDNTDEYYPVTHSWFDIINKRLSELSDTVSEIISSGGSGYILPEASPTSLGGVYTVSDADFAAYIGID